MNWLAWVEEYVETHLPDPANLPMTETDAFGFATGDNHATCDACRKKCRLMCITCGAGMHGPHAFRHKRGDCEGEDHFPRWFREGQI